MKGLFWEEDWLKTSMSLKFPIYKIFFSAFIVALGAVITFEISKATNSVFGAGLVGLLSSLVLPNYAIFPYIGAFVGMSSAVILPSLSLIIAASCFSTLLWFVKQRLPELGGKAGLAAFLGVGLANIPRILEIAIYRPLNLKISHLVIGLFVSIVSIFLTLSLREIFKELKSDAVFASSIIGIIFGLLSFFFSINPFPQIAFASSFAAMTSLKLIENKLKYSLKTGILVVVVFFTFCHFFPGFGGKLGTTAFFATSITFLTRGKSIKK